jgi:aspartate/methionine/tyrosine aminotransferase
MNSDQPTPPLAILGARDVIRRAPLENLSGLAKGAFGDPNVIPLWFGESDLMPPAFLSQAMSEAIEAGHVFYTHQNGIPELRQALAAYLTDLGDKPIGADRVTVTAGGMNALMLAIQLIAQDGDNVIVIDPVWPNLAGMARLVGAEARSVAMELGADGWRLDLGRVAAAMDDRTRAVFFASPGNPTGAMIPMDIQRGLLELCRARGAWLLADEVYHRLVFGARSAPSILDIAQTEDRLLVANTFSKTWAMTGWRLGWLVHPPSLGPTLAMMVQYTTSGVTTFLQHAGLAAVTRGEPFVDQVRAYCEQGMGIVCDALGQMARVRLGPRPAAGMYVFLAVDGMTDSRAACLEILARTSVGVAPGYFFGPGADGYLRICVARAPSTLVPAMEKLSAALA